MSDLSFVQYTGDGVNRNFSVPFPYLSKDHVLVQVNGVNVTFTWLDDQTIQTGTAPANGAVVDVRRRTPRSNRMVVFNDGSILRAQDLNLAAIQTFYITQEALDIAGGTLLINPDGSYSANGRRISDVGTPANAGDVVNKTWAETAMSSQVSQATSAKNEAETARDGALNSEGKAYTYRNNAYEWANRAEDSQFTDSASRTGYSAFHYKQKAETAKVAAESARDAAQTAQGGAEAARDTAITEANRSTTEADRSTAEADKSFDWANSLSAMTHPTVSGTFYSAVVWATASGVPAGSSQEWAIKAPGTSIGTTGEFSAKHYASEAAASAVAAADSAASVTLPSVAGNSLGLLRVKADETGYELRTPTQVRGDIAAAEAVGTDYFSAGTPFTDIVNAVTTLAAGDKYLKNVWTNEQDPGNKYEGAPVEYTIPKTGLWHLSWRMTTNDSGGKKIGALRFVRNGTSHLNLDDQVLHSRTDSGFVNASASWIGSLTAGDKITFQINAGVSLSGSEKVILGIDAHRIG